jgi:hypothetical protein
LAIETGTTTVCPTEAMAELLGRLTTMAEAVVALTLAIRAINSCVSRLPALAVRTPIPRSSELGRDAHASGHASKNTPWL